MAIPSSDTLGRSRDRRTYQPPSTKRCTALAVVGDSGLLIAAVNRGDRHHAWATGQLIAARQERTKIGVPDVVVGEAYTKLRYDRRVSPRKDATIALTVFRLVDENGELFHVLSTDGETYRKARDILTKYLHQSFSYVDAVVFTVVDADSTVRQILTVDGRDFSIYRFAHAVEIVLP